MTAHLYMCALSYSKNMMELILLEEILLARPLPPPKQKRVQVDRLD